MRVSDVMRQGIPTLKSSDSVRHAARMLLANTYPAMPVVDDEGLVQGVVGIVQVLALGVPEYTGSTDLGFLPADEEFPVGGPTVLDESTVTDMLKFTDYEAISEDDALVEVARVMVQRHLLLCPVVDNGYLRGFITRRDLVRAMLGETPPLVGDGQGGEAQ